MPAKKVEKKTLQIYVPEDVLKKFRSICKMQNRSMNGAINYLISNLITQWEKAYGKKKK